MNKPFIHEDFMLTTGTAQTLFHECAAQMPIVDYHCHLNPEMIARNHQFQDITELWLGGDHYKWRAMRANGVPEEYITGTRSSREKFMAWAATMPYAMRNPLYHWSHLELARVFGITDLLSPETADRIFDACNEMLSYDSFRAQELIRRFNVEVVCTTDDPVDDLRFHQMIKDHPFGVKVLPAWRPDKVTQIGNVKAFQSYVEKLSDVAKCDICDYDSLLEALQKRHDFFHSMGCRLSDHGLDTFHAAEYTHQEINDIFKKGIAGIQTTPQQQDQFLSAMLHDLAVMDAKTGWTQQFHVGAIRNNNTRMFQDLGPDTGYDAIHDLPMAEAGHRFLDGLEKEGHLAKTILYCLNPKDFETLMTMAYTFNDGSFPGKMQLGSGWWFLDQEDGMRRQINALSYNGLLSRFVGMLTDSRSFISYPRHEYFRRILCSILGEDVESGRLPQSELPFIGEMVRAISYGNARNYFGF